MADNLLSSFLPDDRASFGIFPQMKPKRRFQDPTGAANVPLDVTRGRVAGLAGLLPDVLNFMGRSPMPTEQFGETQYEPTQQLPYGSEYFLQNLPLKPTSRIGEVAGQAGAFVPLNPMPAARAVAAGVKALGPTAVRMGEGYLQSKGLMPGVVPEAPVPPATPLASMIEKPQAPVSELGFYSAAEQAALNLPRKSGTGESFLNDLMKGQDVKKDELSWMGLDDYLKGKPNVTRQEVQDFIANNRVDVREVKLDDVAVGGFRDIDGDLINAEVNNPTKYSSYQLPGGENYREILLTLPEKAPAMYPNFETYFKAKYSDYADSSNPAYAMAQRDAKRNWDATGGKIAIDDFSGNKVGLSTGNYTSSHFDQPNILAHMRVNDRVDADGKKMLLIEEIQSDWHQAGKDKGYQTKSDSQIRYKILDKDGRQFSPVNVNGDSITNFVSAEKAKKAIEFHNDIVQKEGLPGFENYVIEKYNNYSGDKVPDAPFKDTWHQLALKRALKYAADNGYDRVGLTTGRQQAERYDLSKQISKVMWDKETGRLTAYDKNVTGRRSDGRTVMDESGVTESKLSDYIGKEAAQKLIKELPDEEGVRFLSGLDLQVGGEGMKKYYDEIYPAFLAKQGKKYNAKTGETRIKTGKNLQDEDFVGAEQRILEALGDYGERGYKTTDNRFFDTYADAVSHEKKISSKDPFDAPIRYIDISPEMRGGVKKGQPLFTAAPIGGIGLGAGTQDQQQNSINSFIQ
jgi:hypothetical protein